MTRWHALVAGLTIGVVSPVASADPVRVEAGPFDMGCSIGDPDCDQDEGPPGGTRIQVPGFAIDAEEVKVSAYLRCLEAGACQRPKDHARNKYCNLGAQGRDDHPINCVDWDQALAYCHWIGGRLPYEAEWEKAARASSTTRYPWGQEASCEHAILDEISPAAAAREPDGCGTDATWPVASRGANGLGLFDMHGNAGEWTMNWYARDAITTRYAQGDLQGPESGQRKVVRGGSWDENRPNLRSSYRNVKPPQSGDAVYGSIGFRCAYDR